MKNSEEVFALYKPHPGKEKELAVLVEKHVPTLKEYGLVTDREPVIVKSKNGTFIEIFEWKSKAAVDQAHEHPAIAGIWEAMEKVGTFECLKNLDEAGGKFVHFTPVN